MFPNLLHTCGRSSWPDRCRCGWAGIQVYWRLLHVHDNFLFVDTDVVFANFIEGVLEVILNVIKAYEDEAIEYGHYILQVGGVIFECAGEVWAVQYGEDVYKDLAVCAEGNGCAVDMNDLEVIEGYDHFAYVLVYA